MARLSVIFYSLYGHNYQLSQAAAEGAREVQGVEVGLYQVAETFSDEIIAKMGATETKKTFAHVPIATMDTLAQSDGIIFSTPTRFGNMVAQMAAFFDRMGQLWSKNTFVGRVGSVMASSNTQHGGQETTIVSTHYRLLHLGMVIVGCPYSEERLFETKEVSGGGPYGATCVSGREAEGCSENELAIARFQGRHVAGITKKLFG